MSLRENTGPTLLIWVDRFMFILGFVSLTLMAILGTANTFTVDFLGFAVPNSVPLSSDLLALLIFAGMPYAQIRNKHIVVDLVSSHFNSWLKNATRIFNWAVSGLFYSVLAWGLFANASQSFGMREMAIAEYPYPIFPFKYISSFAILFLVAILIVQIVRSIRGNDTDIVPADPYD